MMIGPEPITRTLCMALGLRGLRSLLGYAEQVAAQRGGRDRVSRWTRQRMPIAGPPSPRQAAGRRYAVAWRSCCAERIKVGIAHRPVADSLVDVVRSWVAEISEEKAIAASFVEQLLAERGDAGARVALMASLRRRVDRSNADAVGRRTSAAREAHRRAIFPDEQAAAGGHQGALHPSVRVLALAVAQRLTVEPVDPPHEHGAIARGGRTQPPWHARHRDDRLQLVDALLAQRRTAWLAGQRAPALSERQAHGSGAEHSRELAIERERIVGDQRRRLISARRGRHAREDEVIGRRTQRASHNGVALCDPRDVPCRLLCVWL